MLSGLNSKVLSFLLVFVLFFPSKFLYFYYSTIIFILFGLTIYNRLYLKNSFSLKILMVIFLGITISALLPVMYFGSSLVKNSTEILRFIPAVLLLVNFPKANINYKNIFYILSIYTLVNFLVNFMQFNNPGMVKFISTLYSSELHINNSLGISNRSLGLSSGPGTNGVISVILSIFFLVTYFFHNQYKKISVFFYVLSFINILFSQSQTSFIAGVLVSLFIFLYFFFKNINSHNIFKLLPLLTVIMIGVFTFITIYVDKLRYLSTLFEMGLARSSYEAREDKVGLVISIIEKNPFFFIFGHGKDFVPYSSGMDNEYVFIVAVYGVFTLSIFLIWYIYSLCFIFLYKNIYAYLVTFTLVCGLILAWPSAFISDPRLMFIFSIYLMLCLNLAFKKETIV